MVQLAVSPNLSAWVAAQVMAYPEVPEPFRSRSKYLALGAALPLYEGWFETIALRPDGEVVSWSTMEEYPGTRPVEDRFLWLSSLVHAAGRHPELGPLLPARPPSARDCSHMDVPLFAEGKVFCPECCGLGWVET